MLGTPKVGRAVTGRCVNIITKASYASWSSSCFSKEYARGWKRGFIDTIRLIPPPPLAACNPEVVGSTPPPSIESKTVVFTVFFALQGCETQVKCTILRFCSYHSIWVALIGFKYSMKKKVSSRARPPWWPCWLPFGGRFFPSRSSAMLTLSVTFKEVTARGGGIPTFPCLAPAKPPPC